MNNRSNRSNSFSRGSSLEEDLRRLIDDERFHDIHLKCSDGETVHGCKAILVTRSDVFNSSIFNGLRNNELSYDNINSTAMKVILEFLHTSKVKKENLTVDNVIEVYYASIHFKLTYLQKHIIDRTMVFLKYNEDNGKKLLTHYVNKFSLLSVGIENTEMSQILVGWVAKDRLIDKLDDPLSLEGLKYLLTETLHTKKPFATPEIEIWKYALMKTKSEHPVSFQRYLTPFVSCIDLNRMGAEEIKKYVEPYQVFSTEVLKNVYLSKATNEGKEFIRGVPIFRWKSQSDSIDLTVSNFGFTVEAFRIGDLNNSIQPKSILGDLIFKGKGVYEWSILIEKTCKKTIYIGICDINEDLNKTDQKYRGWVLGSDGYVYYDKSEWKWYDAKFKGGDKVTVHLDMKMKTCAFSINNSKNPIISVWKNIPSQVCPIASLEHGSKLRIEPYIRR